MQGQLGERLISNLILELAGKKANGLLRLSRGKIIKAVFFESGVPVFAISNLSTEQLGQRLLKAGLIAEDQVARASQLAGKSNRLGSALVEIGALSHEQMQQEARDLALRVIISLFEWNQGDYAFDERIRADHDATLEMTAGDVLLEGARHAADIGHIAQLIAPQNALVARAAANGGRLDSGRLIPVESYILSRIDSPTPVSEVGAISGVPDEEASRTVCALLAAGYLKRFDDGGSAESVSPPDETVDKLREELARRLDFLSSADYYEILGVTMQATTGEIKTAYYQMAKRFHPDRYHQPEHHELRPKLEALFAKISEAYETLKEPDQRAAYNAKLRKSSRQPAPSPLPTHVPSTPAPQAQPDGAQEPGPEAASDQEKADAPDSDTSQSRFGNPTQMAEQYYAHGRARYERKEYHAAVHLLREAVRLDPSRPNYHFHLGMALVRNPRTRHEAERHLAKAAELDPYSAQVRVKLGLLYKEAGLRKKSDHYLRQALDLDPANRVALRELEQTNAKGGSGWGSFAKRLFKK